MRPGDAARFGGRAAGVDFLATTPGMDSAMEVGLALVMVATLASFAAGSVALALAGRRSATAVTAPGACHRAGAPAFARAGAG